MIIKKQKISKNNAKNNLAYQRIQEHERIQQERDKIQEEYQKIQEQIKTLENELESLKIKH